MRIRTIFLLGGLFLCFTVLHAQNLLRSSRQAIEGQVFVLETSEAKQLVTGQTRQISERWLENIYSKFPSKDPGPQNLPPGHYISTKVIENQVQWSYIQVPICDVYVENDQEHLMLKVVDATGEVIPDALIKLGELILPFDELTQTYKTDAPIDARLLEIEVGGMTQFYQLSRAGRDHHRLNVSRPTKVLNRWVLRPLQGWILKPILLTMTLPFDLVRIAVHGRLYGWPQLIATRVKQTIHLGRRMAGRGNPVTFIVCSQPRYRPGDTVQVKAFLTDKNGSPLRRPLDLYFNDKSGAQRRALQMQRLRPGCYTGAFVLADTLNLALDRNVTLGIPNVKGTQKGQSVVSTSFYYEDYELNQFTFAMGAEADVHWLGKPEVLFLEAKDMNGLTVPDARAKFTVLSRNVEEWQSDHTFLPDTLWAWAGNLDASGETRIALPESLFRDAAFQYEVLAECWSSDNERKTQNLKLSYLHDKGQLKLAQSGQWLQVDYLFHGASTPKEAEMFLMRQSVPGGETKKVQLPAKIFLNPSWVRAVFTADGLSVDWDCPRGAADLNVVGQHLGDSIKVRARSTSGLTFAWHLFEGNDEVASGNAAQFAYHAKSHPNKVYYLNVHGTFGGQSFSEDYTFHCPQNALQVAWNGPSTIYPGMTAEMQVQVHDRRGHPVKKADLTAYAVNSRFEGAGKPSISVRGERVQARKRKGNYSISKLQAANGILPLNLWPWVLSTRIDTLPWYQFLYPGNDFYVYRHPIEARATEIAPFVVKGGAIQPVQVVYIDGEPVYFAWSQPQTPYSFPIRPGMWHMIEIRLPDQVVRINDFIMPAAYKGNVLGDTIVLDTGTKTIISVDLDHPPRNVTVYPMPREVTPAEQAVINTYTFGYRRNSHPGQQLISFGERIFPMAHSSGIAGPAIRGAMNLENVGNFSQVIDYEPIFEFDFGPKTVKMRTLNAQSYPKTFSYSPSMAIEARPWRRDSMVAQFQRTQLPAEQPRRLAYRLPSSSGWYYGRLLLEHVKPAGVADNPKGIILHDEEKGHVYVLNSNFSSEMRAPLGKWGMYLMLENEHFVQLDSLDIQPNGRNFLRIRYVAHQIQDSIPKLIFKLIQTTPTPITSHGGKDYYDASWGYYPTWNKSRPSSGRKVKLSGTVTDIDDGEPMVAAMLYCNGFGVGTYTDFNGHYEMSVPIETDSIVVRYLGYQPMIIAWDGKSQLDIQLIPSSILLDETVVVTAHYPKEMMSKSSSINVISSKNIDLQMSSNIPDALVQMSGVQIIDGVPNGASTVALTPAFPAELMAELDGKSVIRKDFRDHAIWEPDLRTDRKGTSSFKVKFPEDITRWDAYAIAVDRRGRTGATGAYIKAWKPLAGRLALPRFLMAGDTCLAIGKVMNYTGDSLQVRRRFTVDGNTAQTSAGTCGPIQLDTLRFSPAVGADSLQLSYLADRTDGYGDGEQWGIKVFPVGMRDTRGTFAALFGDTTLQVPAFQSDGGPVQVRATTRFQELLLAETQRIHDYTHLCNEQLSSKLIALLCEQQIFKSLGRPWSGQEDVETCVKLLEKRITPEQGVAWGWWPGMKPEIWVSLHVTQALIMARQQGYTVRTPMLEWVPGILLQFDYQRYHYNNIEVLQLLQSISPALDIRSKIEALDTLKFDQIPYQLAIMELRQIAGMPIDMDSLHKMAGAMFKPLHHNLNYSSNYSYSSPYSSLEPVLRAYRILRRAGTSKAELFPYLRFLLESRGINGWGNTYLTAQVLMTLIPDVGIDAITVKPKVTLQIDGQRLPLSFDSTLILERTPSTFTAHKEGYGLVIFTAFQRWFNAKPQLADSLFAIRTEIYKVRNGKPSDTLAAGEPVTLRVTLHMKRNMDYVMLEIPIPAGCSYGAKSQGYNYWNGSSTYREYFREKVACYYRNLNAGTYYIDIPLQPRYNGRYVLNCAHAEQMYLPLLSGNNEVRRIQIGAGL